MRFDVKFDLRRKVQLVSGGNTIWSRDKDAYCGVVNIDIVRTVFFLGQKNDLEVSSIYVSNYYPHGFTKDNI